MKKSDINAMPRYFDRFINTVADVELPQAFDDSIEQLDRLDKTLLANLDGKTYAPGRKASSNTLQILSGFSLTVCCCLLGARARFRRTLTRTD